MKDKRQALFDRAIKHQLTHYGGEGVEEVARATISAMVDAKIDDAKIYASAKTGLLLTADNAKLRSKEDVQEFEDAVREYPILLALHEVDECPDCGGHDIMRAMINTPDKDKIDKFVTDALSIVNIRLKDLSDAIDGDKKKDKAYTEKINAKLRAEIEEATEQAVASVMEDGQVDSRACVDIDPGVFAVRAVIVKSTGDSDDAIRSKKGLTASVKLFFDVALSSQEIEVSVVPEEPLPA